MAKTADNLVYEVAGILGISVAGEALGDVEYQTIDSNINPVLAEISGITYIGDRDDIPDNLFQTIARLVAVHSASKFSGTSLDLAAIQQHEQRLRYLVASSPTRRPLQVDYF